MSFKWVGPFQINTYLENAISKKKIWVIAGRANATPCT